MLDQSDFKWGLQSGKIFLTEQEVDHLLKAYDAGGKVNYKQFLNDLRGKTN